ncbi:MAG TPA: hypothetical protein VFW05_04610 [Verrucomicrobiae bacterium]|nr:hypothetical protein [Verrucomicrobiae bacterium]
MQQDQRIIACEICKEPFVSIAEGVRLLSKEEIAALASAIFKDWRIKLLLKAFPIVVLVGVAAAALFLNWSAAKRLKVATAEIERTSTNEIARALSVATNQLAYQFRIFAYNASNQVIDAYSAVTNQIAEEFQTPRIKQTVESVAKGEAKTILEGEVQPAVISFKKDALFMRTIARAQGYDFRAYQTLLDIEKGTNEDARTANQILNELDKSLSRDRSVFSSRRTFAVVSGTNFYSGPFTSDELAPEFQTISKDQTSFNREGFVNTASDLKQPLFMPFFIDLFTNETDLGVADRLAIAISELAKEDFHPRDFKRVQTWWTAHHNEYTNWPVSDLITARNHFYRSNSREALNSLQKILDIDPSADNSRAFAIACNSKIGDTNSAMELFRGFKQPEARWAQWATAFVELQNGNVSNATVKFADLTKKHPTLIALPKRRYGVWSKIDWNLYDKLISADKPE